jgi:hypothetical protein
MRFQFNFEVTKFRMFVLLAVVIFVGAGIIVMAQIPPSPGHSANAIGAGTITHSPHATTFDLNGITTTGTLEANKLSELGKSICKDDGTDCPSIENGCRFLGAYGGTLSGQPFELQVPLECTKGSCAIIMRSVSPGHQNSYTIMSRYNGVNAWVSHPFVSPTIQFGIYNNNNAQTIVPFPGGNGLKDDCVGGACSGQLNRWHVDITDPAVNLYVCDL